MGACCSAAAGSDASHDAHGLPPAPHGATGLGFGGSGGALAPFEDFSSLSTRKSAEKLETVTEEKDSQQGSPQHTGRHVPMQGSPRITGRTKSERTRDCSMHAPGALSSRLRNDCECISSSFLSAHSISSHVVYQIAMVYPHPPLWRVRAMSIRLRICR